MNRPYGDPLSWEEVPPDLTAAVVEELTRCGWTDVHASEHSITVPLNERAWGLVGPAAEGEHLYVLWGGPRWPAWSWCTAHPNAPTGGALLPLYASHDDPKQIAALTIRVLRTGRALP
ncbi:hypothetical protein AB0A05_07590 [Streptomyces sp. NPDC046374]|uniref:hypothetical protein n=1 Tax=Streptomyces sp. NPDC046374 TaxID=3154917 RepID=UPI0034101796